MTTLILKEGKFLGFHEEHGFVYRLNGSYYGYKNCTITLLKGAEVAA